MTSSLSNDDSSNFSIALSEFETSQLILDKKLEAGLTQLEANFSVLDHVAEEHRTQEAEHAALNDMLKELIKQKTVSLKKTMEFRHRLSLTNKSLHKMRAVKPRTGSLLLLLTLGRVNTKVWKKSELVKMKSEYNKYKSRSTIVFLSFALMHYCFDMPRLFGTLHQLWMLYFYLSLAIRENILLANGSNIMSWWIFHHYLTMCVSIVTLLFPDGQDYQWFSNHFSAYMSWQGVVMILQSYYQRRRHYVRTSLGKAKDIDLSETETLVEKPTDLKALIPLLFITYIYQSGAGILLMYRARDAHFSWHLLTIGLLTAALGIGNCVTTVFVLNKKRSKRHHKRQ